MSAMPNRIIKESICTSADIDELTPFQETMFYRLIVNCDDYGLFDGRLKILKAKLFPLKDISLEEIAENLNVLVEKGMVLLYEAEGAPYLMIKAWDKHQQTRSQKSRYPKPENLPVSKENIGNQMISDDIRCSLNPIQNESESNKEIESESNKRARGSAERFERFWASYPKKVGKGAAEKAFAKYKPDDVLTDRMIRAVETAKLTDQWRKDNGQYIPNPATWLNQKRWEDEPMKPPDSEYDDRGLKDWGVWTSE